MQESHIVSLLKTQQSSASFLGLKINCWTVGNARLGLFYTVIFSQIFSQYVAGRYYKACSVVEILVTQTLILVIFMYDSSFRINKNNFYWKIVFTHSCKWLRICSFIYLFIHLFIYFFVTFNFNKLPNLMK